MIEPLVEGVGVTYVVQENPIVREVRFEGNEVYTEEELKELVFTKPGNIFNSVFSGTASRGLEINIKKTDTS